MEENVNVKEVYANSLTVVNTFFDFCLSFKKDNIISEDEEQKTITEEVARIRMSPQMAKAFSLLLQNNIQNYEQQFGEIPEIRR
ncbi:MAG: DUF3467 domain-containing protein [Lachnospiraceae bacterium]|nr:DUF3467 domain-containing protein [Clostridiales bacterium]MCD7812901.1 DUF3467 domain-containing protein [Lachnospiraceae bacterium]MCD8074885.1 DUF3467 domain-containing protein [Lachnospiraceae bacterium]